MLCNLFVMIDQSAISAHQNRDSSFQMWANSGRKAVMRLDPTGRTAGPMPFFGFINGGSSIAAQEAKNNFLSSNNLSTTAREDFRPDIAYENSSDEFSFGDVIDMINPLQHLPVLGMIYRNITGDTIKPISNIIGGTIFGGPIGAVSSTINVIVKDRTGKDIAENVLSIAGFGVEQDKPKSPEIMYEVAAQSYDSTKRNFAKQQTTNAGWNA